MLGSPPLVSWVSLQRTNRSESGDQAVLPVKAMSILRLISEGNRQASTIPAVSPRTASLVSAGMGGVDVAGCGGGAWLAEPNRNQQEKEKDNPIRSCVFVCVERTYPSE